MSGQNWWINIIQGGLFALIMGLVMGWLARSRLRKPPSYARNVLKYPRSYFVAVFVCFSLFAAFAVLVLLYLGTDGFPLISSIPLGFAGLGAYLIADYFRVRHHLEPDGLRYRSMIGGRGFLRWEDVVRIRYSNAAKWFRIDGAGGEVVRISAFLTSLPEFAGAVLKAVPQRNIDPDALTVLRNTAAGSPPPIWR
jgi:hypothetical protein